MMKGNEKAATNNIGDILHFKKSANIEKGSDPMPRGRGPLETTPMKMELKEFSRTKDTSCGPGKY